MGLRRTWRRRWRRPDVARDLALSRFCWDPSSNKRTFAGKVNKNHNMDEYWIDECKVVISESPGRPFQELRAASRRWRKVLRSSWSPRRGASRRWTAEWGYSSISSPIFFMLTKPSKYWKYKYNTQAYLVLFLIFSKPSKYWRKKLKTLKQNYCTGVQKWMKLLWFLQCEYFGHLILNFELLLFKI